MTAEAIARVIKDIGSGNVQPLANDPELNAIAVSLWDDPVIVDATALYHSLVATDKPIYIYEDHPCIAPPWDEAAICYVNERGNVIVMHSNVMPLDRDNPPWTKDVGNTRGVDPDEPPLDWSQVRWRLDTWIYIGGETQNKPVRTMGPAHLWQFAINGDGEPADLHWVQIVPRYPLENWDMANLVLLGALDFMNCRNVELVEPKRPRAETRRLARTGIRVHTINVFPVGKTRRGRSEPGAGVPLSKVRGHFAKYGPEYDRGLLFGKYAGRFFIAQHIRGNAELGETKSEYKLRTEESYGSNES